MKQHFDRYFELFPLIVIIVALVANEHRQSPKGSNPSHFGPVFDFTIPSVEMQSPRLILR